MPAWPSPERLPAVVRGCARCRAALVAIVDAPRPAPGEPSRVLTFEDALRIAGVARAAHGPASALVPDDGAPLASGDWCRAVRRISELGAFAESGGRAPDALRQARTIARQALGRER